MGNHERLFRRTQSYAFVIGLFVFVDYNCGKYCEYNISSVKCPTLEGMINENSLS